jgi:uncharacterized protein YcfL
MKKVILSLIVVVLLVACHSASTEVVTVDSVKVDSLKVVDSIKVDSVKVIDSLKK